MPRTAVKVETFYQFDELSDEAKEKAREWWRNLEAQDFDHEFTYEDAKTCGKLMGLDIDDIRYSGFWSQGDGASWAGHYNYVAGSPEAIRQHAPNDAELHRIADALHALQAKHLWLLIAQVTFGQYGGSYVHSNTMQVQMERMEDETGMLPDINDPDPLTATNWAADEAELTQLLRDFADWIYGQLRDEYEYRMTDENVDENITCNEYEFTEEGERA